MKVAESLQSMSDSQSVSALEKIIGEPRLSVAATPTRRTIAQDVMPYRWAQSEPVRGYFV
jgi:hypothetical protein